MNKNILKKLFKKIREKNINHNIHFIDMEECVIHYTADHNTYLSLYSIEIYKLILYCKRKLSLNIYKCTELTKK